MSASQFRSFIYLTLNFCFFFTLFALTSCFPCHNSVRMWYQSVSDSKWTIKSRTESLWNHCCTSFSTMSVRSHNFEQSYQEFYREKFRFTEQNAGWLSLNTVVTTVTQYYNVHYNYSHLTLWLELIECNCSHMILFIADCYFFRLFLFTDCFNHSLVRCLIACLLELFRIYK